MRAPKTAKQIGDWGEQYAVNYLRLHGYTVKDRNWRFEKCELDVVAATLLDVVFVEVKTRSYDERELEYAKPPGSAVNAKKQRLTRLAARRYLLEHPTHKRPRMDVIEIWLQKRTDGKRPRVLKLNHIKGAY